MSKKAKWKIPLTPSRGMYSDHWQDAKARREEGVWHDNFEFDAELEMLDFDWGARSAKRIWFQDRYEDRKFVMFASELKNTLLNCVVKGIAFSGRFTFRKQGSDYSIRAVGPSPCPHCGVVPEPDPDGGICHECSGARFWSTRVDWERSVKAAKGGMGTDSSTTTSGSVSICTPSGMHPVRKDND